MLVTLGLIFLLTSAPPVPSDCIHGVTAAKPAMTSIVIHAQSMHFTKALKKISVNPGRAKLPKRQRRRDGEHEVPVGPTACRRGMVT